MSTLLEAIDFLNVQQQELCDSAQELIDGYWGWFTEENNRISTERANGLTDKSVAKHAPVLSFVKSGSAKKPYLMWRVFDASPIRKVNPKYSGYIPMPKTGNYLEYLSKKCTWEASHATELEKQLSIIREEINGLNQAIVRLRAAERKIQKLNSIHQ